MRPTNIWVDEPDGRITVAFPPAGHHHYYYNEYNSQGLVDAEEGRGMGCGLRVAIALLDQQELLAEFKGEFNLHFPGSIVWDEYNERVMPYLYWDHEFDIWRIAWHYAAESFGPELYHGLYDRPVIHRQ
ncbi:hypothetical protein HY523_01625 [Candidatus Berkelbacteria bacterium]|nr:hypothetical protein [Candidatus Berkelbacteria bacterium]